MSVTVYDIYEEIKDRYELKCIGGRNGIQNHVNWVYYMEDITTLDFIRGGEILITTGMNCKEEAWMTEMIEMAVQYKASAIVVNVGQYIHEISENALAIAEEKQLPVLVMPWRMRIVDFTQDICNMILTNKQQEFHVKREFYGFFLKGEDINRECLEEHGLFVDGPACVCKGTWKIPHKSKNIEEEFENYYHSTLEKLSDWYVSVVDKEQVFVLCWLKAGVGIQNMKVALFELEKNKKLIWGIGLVKEKFEELAEGRSEAEKALYVGQLQRNTVTAYEDIGVYQILLEIENTKVLKGIYDTWLGIFEQFPDEEKRMYLETLRNCIECNGSIQKMAERSYLHRNTVNYRMKKLKEIIPEWLEDEQAKFMILLSFFIGDMILNEKQ